MSDFKKVFAQQTLADVEFRDLVDSVEREQEELRVGGSALLDSVVEECASDCAEEESSEPRRPWSEFRAFLEALHERQRQLRGVLEAEPINHGSVYLHVSNSGVSIGVEDAGHGPTLTIKTSAFGNLVNEQKLHVDSDALFALGVMLISAAKRPFTETYCHPATISSMKAPDEVTAAQVAQKLGFELSAAKESCLPPRDLYDCVMTIDRADDE